MMDGFLEAGCPECCTVLFRTSILPNNSGVHWRTCLAIPEQRSFTLIGDAYTCDGYGLVTVLTKNFFHGDDLILPDIQGVVLNTASLWIMLFKFLLG